MLNSSRSSQQGWNLNWELCENGTYGETSSGQFLRQYQYILLWGHFSYFPDEGYTHFKTDIACSSKIHSKRNPLLTLTFWLHSGLNVGVLQFHYKSLYCFLHHRSFHSYTKNTVRQNSGSQAQEVWHRQLILWHGPTCQAHPHDAPLFRQVLAKIIDLLQFRHFPLVALPLAPWPTKARGFCWECLSRHHLSWCPDQS